MIGVYRVIYTGGEVIFFGGSSPLPPTKDKRRRVRPLAGGRLLLILPVFPWVLLSLRWLGGGAEAIASVPVPAE